MCFADLRCAAPFFVADIKLPQIHKNIIVLLESIGLKCSDSNLYLKIIHRTSLKNLRILAGFVMK